MIPMLVLAGMFGVTVLLLTKNANAKPPDQPKGDDALSDLAKTGIVGAIAATAIGVIKAFRGTAHLRANEWVQTVQNPFGQALSQLMTAHWQLFKDGTATRATILRDKAALQHLWDEYKITAEQFAAKGVDYRTVINQSYNTLTPLVTKFLTGMDDEAAQYS